MPLGHGARIGAVDNKRRSAYDRAVLHPRKGILRTLLQHHREGKGDGEVDLDDSEGPAPVHIEVERGNTAVLQGTCAFEGAKIELKADGFGSARTPANR